jgi:hypothetical protein
MLWEQMAALDGDRLVVVELSRVVERQDGKTARRKRHDEYREQDTAAAAAGIMLLG